MATPVFFMVSWTRRASSAVNPATSMGGTPAYRRSALPFGQHMTSTQSELLADAKAATCSRRFHLSLRRSVQAHQLQVFDGRTAGTVTRRGLDPVGAQFAANLAKAYLLVVVQIAVLEDDLDLLPGFMRGLDDAADVIAHVAPISAQNLADVDYHVELFSAAAHRAHA